MASSIGPKVIVELTLESVSEDSIPGLELSEPKENCVIRIIYEAAASTTKGDKSIMNFRSTMSEQAFGVGPKIGAREPHQALAAEGSNCAIDLVVVVEADSDNKENKEDLGPYFLIDVTEEIGNKNVKVMAVVSMIATSTESANTHMYTTDFILELNPTITIRKIQFGISKTFDICYEDMALVYIGKFLSDARSVEYYFIDNGKTLHLIVESPDQLFKEVFEVFIDHGFIDEKAWLTTRSLIHVIQTKYHVGGLDETPEITKEQLLYELEHLDILDTDDIDDSSADEDGDDLSSDDDEPTDDNESSDDDESSVDDDDNSEDDVSDCD